MLLGAALIWGVSFVFMKDAVEVMEPATLVGFRFLLTALLMTAVFWRRMRQNFNKDHLTKGALIGIFYFLAYLTQTEGLDYTTPGINAFLTATYCVMVPFLFWVAARKKPSIFNIVAACLCIAGVGFVSLTGESLRLGYGEIMTLVCAFFFGVHIVLVAQYALGCDVLVLTVYQFWVAGICGLALGMATESAPNWAAISPEFIWNMAFLVIAASGVAMVFQNVGLAHVPPAQASLLMSFESVFGVLFSVLLYGEQLSVRLVVGFALIFTAVLVSELLPGKQENASREGALKGVEERRSEAQLSASSNGSASRATTVPPQVAQTAHAAADLLGGDSMALGELEEELRWQEKLDAHEP